MMLVSRFDAPRIIGVLALAAALLLAGGCSVMRSVGYQQGPNLFYWRLDGYFDFNAEQAPRARAAIADWFGWHRATQLPDYIALVARLRTQLAEPATPAIACRWWGEFGERLDSVLARAVHELAPLALTLTPQQLAHLERRFAKSIDEMRRDYLPPSPDERRSRALKRTVDRFEMFYGRLDDEQRQRIAAGVAASPFEAERFITERAARHQDTLTVLRRLAAGTSEAEARTALLELARQTQVSPRADYRDYQRRLIDYNCAFAVEIHNRTTPKQRQTARERLTDWEDDFRSWAANG